MENFYAELGYRFLWIISLIGIRYFGIAGIAFLFFYVLRKRLIKLPKIQPYNPNSKDYFRDIGYSLFTILVFALVGSSLFIPEVRSFTQIYPEIEQFGYGYFFFSIFLIILTHDTYFYWMHRLIHHPKIFKRVHLVHHKSTNPSPWTALAFHPTEAVLEAAIIYIVAILFPVHRFAIFAFLMFMFVYNVYGHLGFELYPKKFHKTVVGKWINTSVSHNQHHHFFHGNYGLYFLWWDRWMGTLRKDYDKDFEKATV